MNARAALELAYRNDARRVRATLIRLLRSFDAAEDALHEAFAAAADSWPRDGVPTNPYAWLVSTGRFRVIDRWRKSARRASAHAAIVLLAEPVVPVEPDEIHDDELRLIFLCCHPALAPDARIALTLREVCGLTTEEIARAYLVPAPTIAQRIVRAKAKIRDEGIPYELPAHGDVPARLESVLEVVYLIANEGYLGRAEFADQARRLGRLILELTDEPEAMGLLALVVLHAARQATRVDAAGELVLLEDQDRTRWDREAIAEGTALVARAFATRRVGTYVLQAAIAALHANAASVVDTDWPQIIAHYDALLQIHPSRIVALNRAAAIAMRDGPALGLAAVDVVLADGTLDTYSWAHAARADLLRRLGRTAEALDAYERALACTQQPAEQRFLARRRDALSGLPGP